jgi:CrcB protein
VTGPVELLTVAVGSAIGGMVRYGVVIAVEARRTDSSWPLGTLIVNLSGCFLLGLLVSSPLVASLDALQLGLIAALGSFTTVSAFVLESWQRRTHPAAWIGYGLVTVTGCLLLFQAGRALA